LSLKVTARTDPPHAAVSDVKAASISIHFQLGAQCLTLSAAFVKQAGSSQFGSAKKAAFLIEQIGKDRSACAGSQSARRKAYGGR